MTLEEAIKYYSELAEENEKDAEQFKRIKATQDMISHCYECAEEHRQLANWLKELKAYKKAHAVIKGLREWHLTDGNEMVAMTISMNTLAIIDKYFKEVNADAKTENT